MEIPDHLSLKNRARLFYRSWIPRNRDVAKALLCIHGFGDHSNVFARLGNFLATSGIATYGLDLRGFGNSVEKGDERGDVKDANMHLKDIDDMVSFIKDKHQNRPVFMLGHSMGGCYTLRYASSRPQPLSGIILVAPAIRLPVKVPPSFMLATFFYSLFAPRKMIDASVCFSEGVRESEEWQEYMKDELCTIRFSARYLMWVANSMNERKLMSCASMVHVPTLILQGEADQWIDPEGTIEAGKKLATTDKEMKTFPEADHFFYHTFISPTALAKYSDLDRRKVLDVVVQWLERH